MLGKLFKAAVGVALTPVAMIDDVINVMEGKNPTTTVSVLAKSVENASDALDELL